MQSVTSNAVAESLNNDFFIVTETDFVYTNIGGNVGRGITFTLRVPDGYKAVTPCGIDTSGPSGAVNCYSWNSDEITSKEGTITFNVWFRNYTSNAVNVDIGVFVLCQKKY